MQISSSAAYCNMYTILQLCIVMKSLLGAAAILLLNITESRPIAWPNVVLHKNILVWIGVHLNCNCFKLVSSFRK